MKSNSNASKTESVRQGAMCGDSSTTHKGMRSGSGKAPNPTAAASITLPAKTAGKKL